jgi:hypothetical protein
VVLHGFLAGIFRRSWSVFKGSKILSPWPDYWTYLNTFLWWRDHRKIKIIYLLIKPPFGKRYTGAYILGTTGLCNERRQPNLHAGRTSPLLTPDQLFVFTFAALVARAASTCIVIQTDGTSVMSTRRVFGGVRKWACRRRACELKGT